MPIKGLSDNRRLPRLGKIHLGVKQMKDGKEYPVPVDYFVFPQEWAELVKNNYGSYKPNILPIIIPAEDEEYWANQYYRKYVQSKGLQCKGDGTTANCVGRDGVGMKEVECGGKECGDYRKGKCKPMMLLQFMLPDLPGLGVWQIDTGSVNAILNINSMASLLRTLYGHVSMIPMKLVLEPQSVKTPEGKQRTLQIMNLRVDYKLQDMQALIGKTRSLLTIGGFEIDQPDDTNPEYILPYNQKPGTAEVITEQQQEDISSEDMFEALISASGEDGIKETSKPTKQPNLIKSWDIFMTHANKILRIETKQSTVADILGCETLDNWTGTLEEALDKLWELNKEDHPVDNWSDL